MPTKRAAWKTFSLTSLTFDKVDSFFSAEVAMFVLEPMQVIQIKGKDIFVAAVRNEE